MHKVQRRVQLIQFGGVGLRRSHLIENLRIPSRASLRPQCAQAGAFRDFPLHVGAGLVSRYKGNSNPGSNLLLLESEQDSESCGLRFENRSGRVLLQGSRRLVGTQKGLEG